MPDASKVLPEEGVVLGMWRMALPGVGGEDGVASGCNVTKTVTLFKPCSYACKMYLGWAEPASSPAPVA